MKIFRLKIKRGLIIKIVVVIAGIGLVLTTFLPFIPYFF
jgi:hypothetical protein